MSVVATSPTSQEQPDDRKRWTQDDCRKLEALEILEPGQYELINGDIILKVGQKLPHRIANGRVFTAFCLTFGADFVLMPGTLPVDENNAPEPDVSVTKQPASAYTNRGNPHPADLRLVVEVADSTLWRDMNTKRRLYARANVPEYWVLDLNNERLLVYRNPSEGDYDEPLTFAKDATVTALAAPNQPFHVADLLP